MVSDLLMNEAIPDKKPNQESLRKSVDSEQDSGISSLNTGTVYYFILSFNLQYFQVVKHFQTVLYKSGIQINLQISDIFHQNIDTSQTSQPI